MDFNNYIYGLSERVSQYRDHCTNEEATKNALVLPFLTALGYDVSNPMELMPEAPCAIKDYDRIDYILSADGEYRMLVECKHWHVNLDNHVKQLEQYFSAALKTYNTHIGLLTNGIVYRFYADTDRPNIMDDVPFFVFDISQPTDYTIERLKMFRRTEFNLQNILTTATHLHISVKLHAVVEKELTLPSNEFVNFLWGRVNTGKKLTKYQRGIFTPMVREEVTEFTLSRINNALNGKYDVINSKIANTSLNLPQDVLQAMSIIRDITKDQIEPSRMQAEPRSGFYAVRLDNDKWRPVCKLHLSGNSQWIAVGRYWPPSRKFYTSASCKHYISNINDIRQYGQEFRDIITVMLLGTHDERIEWVNKHHQDWLQ